jgi:hypothetical protein
MQSVQSKEEVHLQLVKIKTCKSLSFSSTMRRVQQGVPKGYCQQWLVVGMRKVATLGLLQLAQGPSPHSTEDINNKESSTLIMCHAVRHQWLSRVFLYRVLFDCLLIGVQ